MTHPEIAKHTQALEEIAAEGLAAIQSAYEDAMAHIASLAGGGATPLKLVTEQTDHSAPTGEITAQAA